MERLGPAPGWEDLWEAHERLLSNLTQAYREVMADVDSRKRWQLARRYQAECAPILRAMAAIPMTAGPTEDG